MLITGYHKAKGDVVNLTDKEISWRSYDVIYIVADREGLFYDAEWLKDNRVVPVGKAFGSLAKYKPEWEIYPPDNSLYAEWADARIAKYPKYNPARLSTFYLKPIKVMRNGEYNPPNDPETAYCIIDNDWEVWDKDCSLASTWEMSSSSCFLYPLKMTDREEEVLEFVSLRTIRRSYLWGELDFNYYRDEENRRKYAEAWKKYPVGRMFRQRMYITANSKKGWERVIGDAYEMVEELKGTSGKRVLVTPYGIPPAPLDRVATELSRWSSSANGANNKYSLFDIMLYETVMSATNAADLLVDPYKYVEQRRQGTNKIKVLLQSFKEFPEMWERLTVWREGVGR